MDEVVGYRHLNHHQRETVERIFQHPIRHDIEWREVEALLESIGTFEWSHDDRMHVSVGEVRHVFIRPKAKEIDADSVVDLRHFLRAAGFVPDEG